MPTILKLLKINFFENIIRYWDVKKIKSLFYQIIYLGGIFVTQKRKTSVFTARIDDEWIEIFREEADRQGISLNTLINKVMKDYSKYGRWSERFGVVLLSHSILARIIACCSEDRLEDAGKKSGSMGVVNSLRSIGIPLTFDNLLGFIENNLGASAKWFDYSHQIIGKKEIIHLGHEFGQKWSIFLANQVSEIFKSILGITTKSEILDNSVTIEFIK